jgi:hypothetical protein
VRVRLSHQAALVSCGSNCDQACSSTFKFGSSPFTKFEGSRALNIRTNQVLSKPDLNLDELKKCAKSAELLCDRQIQLGK